MKLPVQLHHHWCHCHRPAGCLLDADSASTHVNIFHRTVTLSQSYGSDPRLRLIAASACLLACRDCIHSATAQFHSFDLFPRVFVAHFSLPQQVVCVAGFFVLFFRFLRRLALFVLGSRQILVGAVVVPLLRQKSGLDFSTA
jgi:hypothetical protein